VYWPGSELNRQGIISLSRVGADTVAAANNQVSNFRTAANYVERTPAGVAEIVWRPNDSDMLFAEPGSEGAATPLGQKKTAILITAAGLPVATGIRIRLVAVYEVIPRVTSGFKLSSKGHQAGITLGGVLNMLDNKGGDWMYNAVHTGAKLASHFGGVGGILSIANGAARIGKQLLSM